MRRLTLFPFTLALAAQAPGPKEGSAAFFQQDPKAVVRVCAERAKTLNPSDPRILAELGQICLALGDRTGAEAAFKDAATWANAKRDGDTYMLIGQAWLKHGYLPEALKAYEQIALVDPRDQDCYRDAGLDLFRAGHTEEAAKFFQKAYELGPKSESVCKEIALAYLEKRMEREADFWLERTLASDPKDYAKDWDKCLGLGRMAYRQGMTALAAKWFERAVVARPNEEHVWMDIATLLAESASSPIPSSRQH